MPLPLVDENGAGPFRTERGIGGEYAGALLRVQPHDGGRATARSLRLTHAFRPFDRNRLSVWKELVKLVVHGPGKVGHGCLHY